MDLAVNFGVLVCEEGDAINPIRFSAIPLPHVILDTELMIVLIMSFEKKQIRFDQLPILYPKGTLILNYKH